MTKKKKKKDLINQALKPKGKRLGHNHLRSVFSLKVANLKQVQVFACISYPIQIRI